MGVKRVWLEAAVQSYLNTLDQEALHAKTEAFWAMHETEERVTLPGIVDTGADATLIPGQHLQAMGARRVFEA